MRSARMVFAAATATAALALAAPAAYADHAGDEGHDKSSYSKEHDKESKHDKESRHDKPHGGMHTGGGALAVVAEDDWGTAKDPKYDPETYKDKGDSQSEDSWSGKHKEGNHDKPRGGMHTGGGGLAQPGVTAGGLAALAVLGTGAYALRRKKITGDVA